jgi:hypothetical protein
MKHIIKIDTTDLKNIKYSLDILKHNIYNLSLWEILKTQYLTPEFCVKYILNNDFQLTEEDEKITVNDVLKLQQHIDPKELDCEIKQALTVRKFFNRIDSFPNFDEFLDEEN